MVKRAFSFNKAGVCETLSLFGQVNPCCQIEKQLHNVRRRSNKQHRDKTGSFIICLRVRGTRFQTMTYSSLVSSFQLGFKDASV